MTDITNQNADTFNGYSSATSQFMNQNVDNANEYVDQLNNFAGRGDNATRSIVNDYGNYINKGNTLTDTNAAQNRNYMLQNRRAQAQAENALNQAADRNLLSGATANSNLGNYTNAGLSAMNFWAGLALKVSLPPAT